MSQSIARSYLFVPGNRPERFEKAYRSDADTIIIDLEDAVSSEHKSAARRHTAQFLADNELTYVRINGCDTPFFKDDIDMCATVSPKGIFLPKAESAADITKVVRRVEIGTAVIPIIESAIGMANIQQLAQLPGVSRLAFGSLDFMLDLGIEDDIDESLLYFRSQIVLASRLGNLPNPIDGVTAAINDEQKLDFETKRAKRLGFGAKFCIHPRQIASVNQGFSPSEQHVAWARRVLEEAEQHQGAFMLEGGMVDEPVILKAKGLLAQAQEI